ncbi:hypothetical protein CLI85_12025 [Tannerella forsythia]|nr:hypothetical protein CLI85_12025 [Tannerella forsythia]
MGQAKSNGKRFFAYALNDKRLNAEGVRPSASGGEPTEQRAGRKKIRLSKRSELPDFQACKRREGV